MVSGLDVSHYQGDIDWPKVRKAGYFYAFAKATEGSHWVDPSFAANWHGMKTAGILRGAYHFYRPGEGALVQAQHLCKTVTLETDDLPLVIDVEKEGLSPDLYATGLKSCLQAVEKLSGVKPIIYCSPGWWNSHLHGDFHTYPLWVAHYTHAPHPNLPHGWLKWAFWQWSSSGQVPGVNGNVDLDRYFGDLAGLQEMTKE